MVSRRLKRGDRIKLVAMPDDPAPVPWGSTGTVEWQDVVDDDWLQVGVRWDNGRQLMLTVPPDRVELLPAAKPLWPTTFTEFRFFVADVYRGAFSKVKPQHADLMGALLDIDYEGPAVLPIWRSWDELDSEMSDCDEADRLDTWRCYGYPSIVRDCVIIYFDLQSDSVVRQLDEFIKKRPRRGKARRGRKT